MSRTVIFDFDGTVALGHAPVDAYVREIVAATADAGLAAAVSEGLGEFEEGLSNAIDAYDVVRTVASERAIDAEVLRAAYLRSRALLATAEVPVEAPEGIVPFLQRLAEAADLALVTNAPSTRLAEALATLGIDQLLPTRHTEAAKPEGLTAIVADALLRGPVLSVGDIYQNDLAPAAALGADTALVGPLWRSFAARTTMAAATLPELYPLIEAWAGVTPDVPADR
ncbi:HAD family hydrolase [Demequina sp.]|uniref:HAD family hydrolase n=1 Tax=Demequina sp. TaxID=2050685 RepID=UPI0025B969F2|nr:HAD family hydrolase [Demequina sp.]